MHALVPMLVCAYLAAGRCVSAQQDGGGNGVDLETILDDVFGEGRMTMMDVEGARCVCVLWYMCNEQGVITNEWERLIDRRMGPETTVRTTDSCPESDSEPMVCCRQSAAMRDLSVAPKPCGTRGGSPTPVPRISGSEDTAVGEFPWMAAVLITETSAEGVVVDKFLCGASLIHPQVALTAAHCVYGRHPDTLVLLAGSHDLQAEDEIADRQKRFVSALHIPYNFNRRHLYNDVALLVLDSAITSAENVGTICLVNNTVGYDGANCTATGWGVSSFGTETPAQNQDSVLKMVDLHVVPSPECQQQVRAINSLARFHLHSTFLCAIGLQKKDTCTGDGGGPLVCPSGDRYVQAGVVSSGFGCGSGVPALYADVARSYDWICHTMQGLGFTVNEPL